MYLPVFDGAGGQAEDFTQAGLDGERLNTNGRKLVSTRDHHQPPILSPEPAVLEELRPPEATV